MKLGTLLKSQFMKMFDGHCTHYRYVYLQSPGDVTMILRSKVTVWHFKYRDQTRQCPCRGAGESFDRVLCWHHNSDTGQHYRGLGAGQHSRLHLLLLVPTHKKMKADGGLNRWSGEVRSYNVFLCGGTGYHTNWIRSSVTRMNHGSIMSKVCDCLLV